MKLAASARVSGKERRCTRGIKKSMGRISRCMSRIREGSQSTRGTEFRSVQLTQVRVIKPAVGATLMDEIPIKSTTTVFSFF